MKNLALQITAQLTRIKLLTNSQPILFRVKNFWWPWTRFTSSHKLKTQIIFSFECFVKPNKSILKAYSVFILNWYQCILILMKVALRNRCLGLYFQHLSKSNCLWYCDQTQSASRAISTVYFQVFLLVLHLCKFLKWICSLWNVF